MAYSVSSRFRTTLASSHNVAVRFEVLNATLSTILYSSPTFVTSPATTPTPGNPQPFIQAGKVTVDKQASVRGRLEMVVVDPTGLLVPTTRSAPLTPWGHIIRVYRGIKYTDGTTEMPRLGTFRITDVVVNDNQGVFGLSITGQDLSYVASRNKVVNYYQSAVSRNYTDVIRDMMLFAYPGVVFSDTSAAWQLIPPPGMGINGANSLATDALVPLIWQEGTDLAAEAKNIANALSCDLFFNRDGILKLVRDPNLNYMSGLIPVLPSPVTTFTEGAQGEFQQAQRGLSDGKVMNAWEITGEGAVIGAGPLRSALAQDTDPTSATYVFGDYGRVTGFETNTYMITQAQVDSYARWRLMTSIGSQETMQVDAFVDTSLDPDDVLAFTRQRIGVNNQLYITDATVFPLTAKDSMMLRMRERRSIV